MGVSFQTLTSTCAFEGGGCRLFAMLSDALLRIKHMNPQLQAAIIQLHPDDADTMDEHFSAKVIKTNGQRPRAPGFL